MYLPSSIVEQSIQYISSNPVVEPVKMINVLLRHSYKKFSSKFIHSITYAGPFYCISEKSVKL